MIALIDDRSGIESRYDEDEVRTIEDVADAQGVDLPEFQRLCVLRAIGYGVDGFENIEGVMG